MSESKTHFRNATVVISGRECPGIIHDSIPGLAVTMSDFGQFAVTHIASERRIGGIYELADNAMVEAVQWGLISSCHSIPWASLDVDEIIEALQSVYECPVPFGNNELSIKLWISIVRGNHMDDLQFAFGDDQHPSHEVVALLDLLVATHPKRTSK